MSFARPIGQRRRAVASVAVRIACAVAAVLPLVVALSYVRQNGRDVPFWDEWDRSAPLAIGAADGSLSLADLARPHNEHRLLFSAIVTVASVYLADWSLVGEMYVGILLSLLGYLLLLAIVRQQSRSPGTVWILCVPLAALVFWPAQWFNWLVGFQTQIFGFMTFSTAAVWVVSRPRRGWSSIVIAAVLGNCAQLSQAGGIGIWPSILIGLWMLDYRRSQLAAWLVLATVSLALFLSGSTIRAPASVDVGVSIAFALAYLGGFFVGAFDDPLASTAIAVAVAGLVLVGWSLTAVIGRDRRWSRAAPWAMLILLGLATAALVSRNRAHLGLSYALVSRYATQASLVWLGLCGLIGCVIDDASQAAHRVRSRRAVASFGVLALVVILYVPTRGAALDHGLVADAHVACLVRMPATREFGCLAEIHPAFGAAYPDAGHREAILRLVDGLARHRLGVFASEGSHLAMRDAPAVDRHAGATPD
jgi:hypothetical protein